MKCTKCSGKMAEKKDITNDGVEYTYFECKNCGEQIVNMKQLQEMAARYGEMKKYTAKLSKWGESIGLRIPKELAKEYGLEKDTEVSLIPEKKAIRIITTK